MSEKVFALYSPYIIDGIQQESTPAELLGALMASEVCAEETDRESIVDETLDPPIRPYDYNAHSYKEYLSNVLSAKRAFPLCNPESYTRALVAKALIDTLWLGGSFRLGNLQLEAGWEWNEEPVGAMAAFYESVYALADYMDALGIELSRYSYKSSGDENELSVKARLSKELSAEDEVFEDDFFRLPNPVFEDVRICPGHLVPDERSWVVFVPFDTCDFLLGASLLAQSLGVGGAAPKIGDADYFIDCYEVVREFVEDGILLSAATVGEGGLISALTAMGDARVGVDVELSDIMQAYQEPCATKVLFSEVPGVILQIRDSDFDYLDAELLLQDVAYFPLGHPVPGNPEIRIKTSEKSGIQTILESLMQKAEGED